ncbi:hypothetical protein CYLTODRAFT_67070 [Cylindrobasidium torrendii FP15055 ss-10]|uniref:Uncharacterized protein n=1 Tax=Cylindrobasidium torrendii FP15055 ss-10 TaxID=1314674 RepID=A0A0D7B554_9AGAR|nr:hypothetical protein CYLTODRAFT_67070 [Cylindrobasidium torrendii FP15055 ss-10]
MSADLDADLYDLYADLDEAPTVKTDDSVSPAAVKTEQPAATKPETSTPSAIPTYSSGSDAKPYNVNAGLQSIPTYEENTDARENSFANQGSGGGDRGVRPSEMKDEGPVGRWLHGVDLRRVRC